MATASSHVFFEHWNTKGTRKVGVRLNRVFITEGKLTVYSKIFVKTAKSGVLFEKVTSQTTISLHQNRHGDKYIKRRSKSVGGSITDLSLQVVTGGSSDERRLIPDVVSSKCDDLIRETILGWFGPLYEGQLLDLCLNELLFPALRDKSFPEDIHYKLDYLHTLTGTATKALRENNSWQDFIKDVASPTIKNDRDMRLIQKNPYVLMTVATLDLGMSLSEAYKMDSDGLVMTSSTFSKHTWKFLRFMFQYGNENMKLQALQTLFSIAKLHDKYRNVQVPLQRIMRETTEVDLQRVPSNQREELAQVFDAHLQNVQESMEKFVSEGGLDNLPNKPLYAETNLMQTFLHWFSKNVLNPQLVTTLTVEDIEDRYFELFGRTLRGTSQALSFKEVDKELMCAITYMSVGTHVYSTDLFHSLNTLVITNRPKDRGSNSGRSYYVNHRGDVTAAYGDIYSLDDIMNIIEAGAVETDKHLTKLGRKITPENRAAFLTLGSKERKFKNTWKLYDWGVTDAAKICALKVSKVMSKDNVQTYSALPDDMFYELLSLEAGQNVFKFAENPV